MMMAGAAGVCDVVVIGGLNTDYLARASELPGPGQAMVGDALLESPGGKGGNQAVAAARFGARVRVVGAVGRDERGERICHALLTAGVDTSGILAVDDAPTGAALIHLDERGQTQSLAFPGANHRLTARHVLRALADVPHARIVMAQLEVPLECVVAAYHWARDAGARTLLDPAPATPLDASVLKRAAIVRANAHEAEVLTGVTVWDRASAIEAAQHLLDRGVGTAAIDAGHDGNVVVTANREYWFPLLDVQAIDPTGAGDAFSGVLAACLARGDRLEDASRRAHGAAAAATTRLGAWSALPSEKVVESLLSRARRGGNGS